MKIAFKIYTQIFLTTHSQPNSYLSRYTSQQEYIKAQCNSMLMFIDSSFKIQQPWLIVFFAFFCVILTGIYVNVPIWTQNTEPDYGKIAWIIFLL